MKTFVKLVIASVGWDTKGYYVLSTTQNTLTIPEKEVCRPIKNDWSESNKYLQPKETAKLCFGELVNLDINWIDFSIESAIIDDEEDLIITFIAAMPFEPVFLKNSYFVPLSNIFKNHLHIKEINKAIGIIS